MHSTLAVHVAFAAGSLAAPGQPQQCGPKSNCEYRKNELGYTVAKYKPGMGPTPGQPDAGNKLKRDEYHTQVKIGKTQQDYGCDASIRKTLEQAFDELCDEKGCDNGSSYSRAVKWTDGSGGPTDHDITVKMDGTWDASSDTDFPGIFRSAMSTCVNPDTAKPEDVSWVQNGFQGDVQGNCHMSRFGNFIQITRFDSDSNVQGELEVTVDLAEQDGFCAAQDELDLIAGQIHQAASGILGIVELSCGD